MILVLVGKSGSGKDKQMKELVNSNILNPVISTTSRPIRIKERNNIDYYFCSKEQFLEKIRNNMFIEYRSYNTVSDNISDIWYYGTEKSSIDISKNSVLVLDVQGLKDLKSYFSNEKIVGIYLHCPSNLRTERAKGRGSFCENEWNRRLEADKIDFENVYTEVDYVVNSSKSAQEVLTEIKDILKEYNVIKN